MKLKSSTFLMEEAGGGDNGGGGGGGSLLGAPPAGGGANDWRASLPEDIRGEAVFSTIKAKDASEALGIVGKMYAGAQKLIGIDKIPKPNDKWTPEQWKEFNKNLGVPETHDKYNFADVKLPEGVTLIPEKVDAFKKVFHEAGLTPRQVQIVSKAYLEDVNQDVSARSTADASARASAETELKQEFGDKYGAKLDMARAVLRKYGSEPLLATLEKTGLANNPEIVRMLTRIADGMMEDHAGGGGLDSLTSAPTQALQEINALKGDAEFQKALTDRANPGHKGAVAKWLQLHQTAAQAKE